MRSSYIIAFTFFILASCINDDSLKPVIPNNILNANSAKTWVRTGELKNGINKAPIMKEMKMTFTLFDNGTFREHKHVHIGSELGRKGHYTLGISPFKDTTLNFYYTSSSQTLSFDVKHIKSNRIKLVNDTITWILETLEPPQLK